MRYGSLCSGIEAATVAWHGLGWTAAWYSEIESFPCAVLAHHYPQTPNLGDMTLLPERIRSGEVEAPDILCGGTPCQAFSVAGQRQSLADARGNLTLTFVEIADAIDAVRRAAGYKPSIIVWENVPGVLNTADNAFGCFLAGVAGEHLPLEPPGGRWTDAGCVLGPSRAVAWRVLDAQHFGLAQRRRRVFVVASARNDFDPAAVLFEWGGMRRDTPPSREAGQGASAAVGRCFAGGRESDVAATLETTAHDYSRADGFTVVAFDTTQITSRENRSNPQAGDPCHRLAAGAHAPAIAFHPTQDPISSTDVCHAIGTGSGQGCATEAVAVDVYNHAIDGDIAATLNAESGAPNHSGPKVMQSMQVRRLTPRECERLQGFPDHYTAIPWRNKLAADCPDGPRYKALGNSWAVPVVRWIGQRIANALEAAP